MEAAKYNCLVVDDEPIARKIISNYIRQTRALHLSAECTNALLAIEHLRSNKATDIVFLDINMPNLSGLQLVKILQPQQAIIFTTAYSEYAVESYDLNATDYLLKPFSFERFTRAVHKAIDALGREARTAAEPAIDRPPSIFIKSDGRNYPVYLDDILYCEAMKNYTMVRLKDGQKLLPLVSLSKLQLQLSEAGGAFLQVHRSFLIAKKHIAAISAGSVSIGQFEIPIGVQFRESFFKAIGMKTRT
jgi:DNA-binding LytR/AlgR family response regulator